MSKTTLVNVKPLNFLNQDERGFTADFSLSRKQDEFIFISRKKGSLSGNTYHQGKNDTTNPKIFILLNGKIALSYRKSGEQEKFRTEIDAPSVIEIDTYVIHNIEALTDAILLECNSIKDIQDDRIREEV